MAPSEQTSRLLALAVPLLLRWMATMGQNIEDRIEATKETLNRACQLLSVHGHWSWMSRICAVLTRTLVAWNSDVANLETIVPSGWDYRQPTQPVLAAIRQMS